MCTVFVQVRVNLLVHVLVLVIILLNKLSNIVLKEYYCTFNTRTRILYQSWKFYKILCSRFRVFILVSIEYVRV